MRTGQASSARFLRDAQTSLMIRERTLEPSQPDRASRSMRFPREAGAGRPIFWLVSLIRRLSDQNETSHRGSENGFSPN
jgi:hypothetical protein